MTIELRAQRIELELNTTQRIWCERACAASRFTYNWGLAEWRRWYRWSGLEAKGKVERARGLMVRWEKLQPVLAVRPVPDYVGKPTAYGLSARLTQAKKGDLKWLTEIGNSYVLRESLGALGNSYAAFFRRLKKHRAGDHSECGKSRRGTCSLGAPRFHARRPDEGFVCDQSRVLKTGMDGERPFLVIPGLGQVRGKRGQTLPRATFDQKAPGVTCTCDRAATGKRSHKPDCEGMTGGWVGDVGVELCGIGIRRWGGRWYASVRFWSPVTGRPRKPDTRMAVEVGLRYRAVTYDGAKVGSFQDTRALVPSATKLRKLALRLKTPEATEAALAARNSHGTERLGKLERRRKLWERRLARRHKPGIATKDQSAGWREAREHVSKLHREIAQCRADRIHFVSRAIVNSGAAELVVREMRVKDLLQRGAASDPRARNVLAPEVHEAGMSELRRELEYKQKWAGGTVLIVGADVPETKKCWACGGVREQAPGYPWFFCPKCGHSGDRDVNAAMVRYDQRTPSGDPVEDPGTRGPSTEGESSRVTAKRSASPVASDSSEEAGAQGSSESSSPLGSGNGTRAKATAKATTLAREKPKRRKTPKHPRPSGLPGEHSTDEIQGSQARERSTAEQPRDDETSDVHEVRGAPQRDRSQSGLQVAETSSERT